MSWRDRIGRTMRPVRMQRVALVAPTPRTRDLLLRVGTAGVVELDLPAPPPSRERGPSELLGPSGVAETPEGGGPQTAQAELARVEAAAQTRGPIAGFVGWLPAPWQAELGERLAEVGAAVVPLPSPRGLQPPTLLARKGAGRPFDPLVETYATVPYSDVDLSLLAGIAYLVMFGMMFGDAGHGAVLLLLALVLWAGWIRRLARLRRAWPFLAGAGLASICFGLLYGEAFGPTGIVPVLWLSPLDQPIPLLFAAVGLGAVLLAGAYAVGTVNRLREGGWSYALYARSGIAGILLFAALGLIAGGAYGDIRAVVAVGVILGATGLVLAFIGLLVSAGPGPGGVVQAGVELFDLVIRLGANVVSFARLAAFGLTHAAVAALVWVGTAALWGRGWLADITAVLLFVIGNIMAFGLEALVAGVQALRLEYYELFSRVFDSEGRPFRPWRLPPDVALDTPKETP
jgi:V/A-type H+-transporting ATPase subunit I